MLASCTGGAGGNDSQASKGTKEISIKPQAEVEKLVKSYADATASAIGNPLTKWSTIAAPCEDANGELATDGRWNMTGHANIAVARAQQLTMLTRLRDQWKQQGYEVTEFRTFPPNGELGAVSVRNPEDGISVSLESTAPGTAFALLIATPCYRPAPGETPGA